MVLFIGQHAHASSEGGEIRAPFIYQQIPVWLLEMYIFRSNRTCKKSTNGNSPSICSMDILDTCFRLLQAPFQWMDLICANATHGSGTNTIPYIGFVFHLQTVSPLVCLAMLMGSALLFRVPKRVPFLTLHVGIWKGSVGDSQVKELYSNERVRN